MKNLNITKGEWVPKPIEGDGFAIKTQENIDRGFSDKIAEHIYSGSDVTLICNAGNTYQRCGKLPSELEKENERLRDLIHKAIKDLERKNSDGSIALSYLQEALKGTAK